MDEERENYSRSFEIKSITSSTTTFADKASMRDPKFKALLKQLDNLYEELCLELLAEKMRHPTTNKEDTYDTKS